MTGVSYCRHFVYALGQYRQRIIQRQILLTKCRRGQTQKLLSDSVKVRSRLEENEPTSQSHKSKKLQPPSLGELMNDQDESVTKRQESTSHSIKSHKTNSIDTAAVGEMQSESTIAIEDSELADSDLPDIELPVKTSTEDEKKKKSDSVETSPRLTTRLALDEMLETDKIEKIMSKSGENRYWKSQINLLNVANSTDKVESILKYNLLKKIENTEKNRIIVCALRRLEKLGVHYLSEECEKTLLQYFNFKSTIQSLGNTDIANILGFFLLANKQDDELTYILLHEACWRLRKTSIHNTLTLLKVLRNKRTEKRAEAYELGKKRLVENIDSVSSPEEMLNVMYLLSGTPDVQEKVEAEASVMLPSMDSIQTYRVLYLLALNKSKNAALISKARKHLCSRPISLDWQKLQNLFFACGVLRIQDHTLLKEMSENALDLLGNKEVTPDSNFTAQLLMSSSRLGWNYKPLTSVLMQNLQDCLQSSDEKKSLSPHLPSIVTSIGHLNLVEHSELAANLVEELASLKQQKPRLWLNMVHSLACLGNCDVTLVQDVLRPEFSQPLMDSLKGKAEFVQQDVKRQLLNMYGYLKEDLQVKDTSWIDQSAGEWKKQLQEQMQGAQLVGLAKAVSTVLSELAPFDKYCNINLVTKYGHVIDFEIFVDPSLKAVKLEKTEGMSRVWIKMLDYSSFVRGSAEPEVTGSTAMTLRHLKMEQNTFLVCIPYTDWSKIDKKLDHLNYLEAKIKVALNPEPANVSDGD